MLSICRSLPRLGRLPVSEDLMRAAVAVGGELVVQEVDDPVPEAGQVLVAVHANGICGSDLSLLDAMQHDEPARPEHRIVPGHEFCAEVIDHGTRTDSAAKRRWPVGTTVCANPFVSADELVGASPRYPGGLGERMVLDIDRLMAVPEGVPPLLAALTEPLAVGIRAVNAASARPTAGPYVVVGCGPIGLAVILALRAVGRGPIVASDTAPARRGMATRLGADVVIDAVTQSPFDQLNELGFTEKPASMLSAGAPSGPVVFECVGRKGVIDGIVGQAPRHTHLIVVGVCFDHDTFVPGNAVVKELAVDFVLAYTPAELTESLRRIAEHVIEPSPLITATLPLAGAPDAIGALRSGEHAKILVVPNDTHSTTSAGRGNSMGQERVANSRPSH